jgi:hypothetical protein
MSQRSIYLHDKLIWRQDKDRGPMLWFLKNIFAEKFSEKIGVFDSKLSWNMQNFDHNIGFWEKRQIFRWILSKIAENCDHNIDSRSILIVSKGVAWHRNIFFVEIDL